MTLNCLHVIVHELIKYKLVKRLWALHLPAVGFDWNLRADS